LWQVAKKNGGSEPGLTFYQKVFYQRQWKYEYVVIYDGTLLCAVELGWAVVVMLTSVSFDFLMGGGSRQIYE